jgi:hypothetical protein
MTTPAASPEAMRRAMADYVRSVHQAYLDAAALLPPAEQARLPLLATAPGTLTVLAVGARNLHVLATREALPAPVGQEVALDDDLPGLGWTLRFFDPVIVPALGLIDEADQPRPDLVRDALGVRTVVYHLTVPPGGGLTPHHAMHAGTGLAHGHASACRDLDAIAALLPRREQLVAELRGADVAGLSAAGLLLARALAPGSIELAGMDLESADAVAVRRALLAHLRGVPS